VHPLLRPAVVEPIERAASGHLGRRWRCLGFTDLAGRSSHPCGILTGRPFSVFAKFGGAHVATELAALDQLRRRSAAPVPTPIGPGVVRVADGVVLLLEALDERPTRTSADHRAIGRTLAHLHQVHDEQFGLPGFQGFFGPFPQDNEAVASNSLADFHAERRLLPALRWAADAGTLPAALARGVERVADRLPLLCGPEPRPSLLHGDAQQNNFVSTAAGAVIVDPAPYFGSPEVDLALLDYFAPVPDDVFAGYREVAAIEAGFAERRELWRLHAYLAVVAVVGDDLGFLARIDAAVRRYR
jgi:fructosamine-3-kinase